MGWPLSDGSSKFIPIDEQPKHQIVHAFRLGKAQRATNQPLHPGPELAVLALDFLRVLLASVMLLGIEMALRGPPPSVSYFVMPQGSRSFCSLRNTSSFRRPNTDAHTFPVW
jgi:hypothetical protein